MYVFLIVLLILLFMSMMMNYKCELFAGALTQLYAKGPQDIYLTGYDHIYPTLFWNIPTRMYNYYYPLYYWGCLI